jgi:hypothetical protein
MLDAFSLSARPENCLDSLVGTSRPYSETVKCPVTIPKKSWKKTCVTPSVPTPDPSQLAEPTGKLDE